jgi:hypothetical protein
MLTEASLAQTNLPKPQIQLRSRLNLPSIHFISVTPSQFVSNNSELTLIVIQGKKEAARFNKITLLACLTYMCRQSERELSFA